MQKQAPEGAQWSPQTYESLFQSGTPSRLLVVVEDQGKLIAFLVASLGVDECELENIVVESSYRREGIAGQLLQHLLSVAREREIVRILLEVRESNAAARAFYQKHGFHLTGRRASYYANPSEDALIHCANV